MTVINLKDDDVLTGVARCEDSDDVEGSEAGPALEPKDPVPPEA